MVTWQRRSSLCSRRVMSVTALGRSSLLLFPFNGPPLFLLPRWRSWVIWSEAIPNFAGTEFSEVRLRYVLRSSANIADQRCSVSISSLRSKPHPSGKVLRNTRAPSASRRLRNADLSQHATWQHGRVLLHAA